jgi:glutamate/tyrosine decarboxylase-like PLP-dependent enzyme
MSLKQYGLARYRKLFERNVALAEYLDQLVRDSAEFEPLCKPVLQMYCFRFVASTGKRIDEEKLDGLNQRIVDEVQRSGKAFLMTTSIRGRTAIRLSITNHRTTKNDIRLTFEALQRTGVKLANASP